MGADKLACKVMDDAGHLPIHIAIGRGDYLDEKNRAVVMALINTVERQVDTD